MNRRDLIRSLLAAPMIAVAAKLGFADAPVDGLTVWEDPDPNHQYMMGLDCIVESSWTEIHEINGRWHAVNKRAGISDEGRYWSRTEVGEQLRVSVP